MSASKPRVLFVSHSASRNGATILLLQELAWLRPRVDWDFEILVHGKGPLLEDFRAIGNTRVWRDPRHMLDAILRGRLPKLQSLIQRWHAHWTLPSRKYDLVYCNTSALARHIPHWTRHGVPLLWHIHELTYALQVTMSRDERVAAARSSTRIVAVSEGVRQAVQTLLGIAADRIDVIHGFVPLDVPEIEPAEARRRRVRAELNLPASAFVVGACGTPGWRKGTDLFLQIASRLPDVRLEFHFVWVGGSAGSPELAEFEHDVEALGISKRCHHVPDTAHVDDLYAAMDIFALTSREDPFPLVMLEAARHRLPLICFEGAGGADEFADAGAAMSVPYLDVAAFANCISRLSTDVPLRDQLALAAHGKLEREHTADVQCGRLLTSMLACMSHKHASLPATGALLGTETPRQTLDRQGP